MMPLFVLIASFVPNFVWLALYLREDPHPEPQPLLALSFFLGMCGTGIALGIEYVILRSAHAAFSIPTLTVYNSLWYMFLGVALMQWLTGLVATAASALRIETYTAVFGAIAFLLVLGTAFYRLLPGPRPASAAAGEPSQSAP